MSPHLSQAAVIHHYQAVGDTSSPITTHHDPSQVQQHSVMAVPVSVVSVVASEPLMVVAQPAGSVPAIDEWLNPESLQAMAELLEECDQEALADLRQMWPLHALKAASKLLKSDARKRIMQWVVEQNAAAMVVEPNVTGQDTVVTTVEQKAGEQNASATPSAELRLRPRMRIKVGHHHGSLVTQTRDGKWFVEWDVLPTSLKQYGEPPVGALAADRIELVEESHKQMRSSQKLDLNL